MFVCVVVSLSQPSSREWYLLYVKCYVCVRYLSSREWHLLYVKCLCVLPRYLRNSREWYLLYVK